MAVGQALIIITGGIDLSVGSLVGFTACFGAMVAKSGASPLLTLIAILGMGAIVGLSNGLLVSKVGLPAFVATLGMMSIQRFFASHYYGVPIHYNPPGYRIWRWLYSKCSSFSFSHADYRSNWLYIR